MNSLRRFPRAKDEEFETDSVAAIAQACPTESRIVVDWMARTFLGCDLNHGDQKNAEILTLKSSPPPAPPAWVAWQTAYLILPLCFSFVYSIYVEVDCAQNRAFRLKCDSISSVEC